MRLPSNPAAATTGTAAPVRSVPAGLLTRPALLVVGFALAVGVRVAVGGPGVSQSPAAGLVFGALLLLLAAASRTQLPVSPRAVLLGLAGGVVLCLPVVLHRGFHPLHHQDGFLAWATVVAFVAVAEEVFLRGALYDAVCAVAGSTAAIAAGAIAFALLHVPLYGWHVVPLDLTVGALLGELRLQSGTPAAPAVTHVGADLAAWFLR